jgi:hypothetical protein
MAKSKKKSKLTTNEALEQLLGHKASKRLRQLAATLAADNGKKKEKGKKQKKEKKAPKAKKTPKAKKVAETE